jgi:hypothetical protein
MDHSSSTIEDALLKERIAQSIDVSPVLNNCFFHAFALYLLVNEKAFPPGLFAVDEHDSESVRDLKHHFQEPRDLEIFDAYAELKNPDSTHLTHFYEKTLVLGVLLRSWFAHWLLKNEDYKALMYVRVEGVPSFYTTVDFFNTIGSLSGLDNVLYLSNKAFFDEEYDVKPHDEVWLVEKYWQNVGYVNYCKYLAEPGTKITPYDFKPLLDFLGISYGIYGKFDGKTVMESEPDPGPKEFELALEPNAGHFYLLPNEENLHLLGEYVAVHQNYMNDRSEVMRNPSPNKIVLCHEKSSMLLDVTLRAEDMQGNNPLAVLVDKIVSIKKFIECKRIKIESPQATPKVEQRQLVGCCHSSDASPPMPSPTPAIQLPETCELAKRPTHKAVDRSPTFTPKEQHLAYQLGLLKNKSITFSKKSIKNKEGSDGKYCIAAQEIDTLHQELSDAFKIYRQSPKSHSDYVTFKDVCDKAIDASDNRGTLKAHRGLGPIITNILLAIAGIGVLYLMAGLINLAVTRGSDFLFFKTTDTCNKVAQIKQSVNDMTSEDSLLQV